MTTDPRFRRRLQRLIVVSALALGGIALLAAATTDPGAPILAMLIAGWATMPTLLAISVTRPKWRYLLALPATLVSLGLVGVAIRSEASDPATVGWWVMAAGAVLGGTLGGWFWYRWMPVPRVFDPPFSAARWTLIAVHAGLLLAGLALVSLAWVR